MVYEKTTVANLTIRQHFVAQALVGLLANPKLVSSVYTFDGEEKSNLINKAIEIADTALKIEKASR